MSDLFTKEQRVEIAEKGNEFARSISMNIAQHHIGKSCYIKGYTDAMVQANEDRKNHEKALHKHIVTGSMFAITETDNYGRTVMHCCFKLKCDAAKHLRDNKRYYEGCEVTEHEYCL